MRAVAKDASDRYSEEISATYSKLSTYTISFSEGHDDIEAVEGETVTLPTLADVGDYTFVGWSETEYTTEVLTATFIAPSEAYTATKNVLFYPVYSIPQRNTENKTASLSISDYAEVHSWTDGTQFGEVIINDVITAIASSTGIYTGSYYTSNKSWRFYESDNGTLTLTISEGTLGSVTFIFEAENYGTMTYNGNRYVSGTSIPLSGKSATFGVTHTKDNNKGKIQIKNIVLIPRTIILTLVLWMGWKFLLLLLHRMKAKSQFPQLIEFLLILLFWYVAQRQRSIRCVSVAQLMMFRGISCMWQRPKQKVMARLSSFLPRKD